jgi:FkbM family methyltransferase
MHDGLQFSIRAHSSDRASVSEVFALNTYVAVPAAAVVLDIRANIGAFTLLAARSAAVIYAIEPVASNFEALRHNVENNNAANVTSHKLAFSGMDGEIEISDAGVESSAYFTQPNARMERVRAFTLETFLELQRIEQVDYLKMDCEGGGVGHRSERRAVRASAISLH